MRHLLLAALLLPAAALSQSDSARARRLDPLVVTASRSTRRISDATAAVTVLSRAELDALPVRTVAQALELIPGIAVLQADGLGNAPQIIARGFYGGGETDYVLLLLDGVPLNGVASGAANWDLVPLGLIESIEVVRGGGSSLYGDVALGAVINLITRRSGAAVRTLAVWRGAFDVTRVDAAVTDELAGHDVSLSLGAHRTGGYRTHESRDALTVRAGMALVQTPERQLNLSALVHGRRFDEPGPLDDSSLAVSPRGTAPFYRFDHTSESLVRLTADGRASMARETTMRGYLAGESDRVNAIRTVPLAVTFADTKRRDLPMGRLIGSWNVETRGVSGADRILLGTDASIGRLTSTYFKMLSGPASAYAASGTPSETLDADGHGGRTAVGAFANWEIAPTPRVRLLAGARYDWLTDRFEPVVPANRSELTATHRAWSPKLSANVKLVESDRQELGAYLSLSRSFKAPTIDQLFDQRSIPVPFPPYSVTTSNALLVPQTGSGVEAGLQHRLELLSGRLVTGWSLSAYQMDMRHELDFDIATLRYVNVAESRHRGIEAAANVVGPDAMTAAVTYALQNAVATNGDNAGRFLRAIPRHTLTARVAHDPAQGLSLSAAVVRVADAPFDNENSRDLPAYTRIDARAAYALGAMRLVGEVRNALDASYNSTGFPDPGGTATGFYYPAAGRVVSIGVEARW